jgi:gas vesicle protein
MTYDDMDDRNGGASFLLGFIAGSVLGAGLALLFAPRTGEETRREVADRAQRLRKQATDEYEAASERVAHLAERGREAYRSAADRARDLAERGRREAHDLAERGRQEAHDLADKAHAAVDDAQARAEAGVSAAKASLHDLGERRS